MRNFKWRRMCGYSYHTFVSNKWDAVLRRNFKRGRLRWRLTFTHLVIDVSACVETGTMADADRQLRAILTAAEEDESTNVRPIKRERL